jgi:FlaA1/EpsC-like NDP-sugar epimerase
MQSKKPEDDGSYEGKSILVTGGVGSIGSEIVKKVLTKKPKVVRVFDNNETALFYLNQEINSPSFRPLLGDIRDKERLITACEDIDIVFHAAALKHVPLCEYNPFEAVKSNVIGTQNILDAALLKNVERFVLVSTDKAVNPNNVMGATKLLSERLTISTNNYRGSKKTKFSCVRLGNVLDSRGSVIPLFKKQILGGQPLTITDVEMTRFMMSIDKAVDLILQTGSHSTGGQIFISKMSALRIIDLAEILLTELKGKDVKIDENIKIVGRRPGEKLHERLMTFEEASFAKEDDEMFIVNGEKGRGIPEERYCSEKVHLLDNEEIRDLLRRSGVI